MGEALIGKGAEKGVQWGTCLGKGHLGSSKASEESKGIRVGWGGIPLLPAAPHTLAFPWRDVSISDGVLPASRWAEAAPGYPRTLAANCVWDYASKSCQPEPFLILLWRKAHGFQAVSTRMQLTGHCRGLVLRCPSILLPCTADLQILQARLSPLDEAGL